jgi:hypothetical protein
MMLGAELVDLSTFARLLIRIALLYSDNLHQEHRKKSFGMYVRHYQSSTICRVRLLSCGQCIVRHYVVWTMYRSTFCCVNNVSFDIMSCGQCIIRHYVMWTMYCLTLCRVDNVSFDITYVIWTMYRLTLCRGRQRYWLCLRGYGSWDRIPPGYRVAGFFNVSFDIISVDLLEFDEKT